MTKSPRIYVEQPLAEGIALAIDGPAQHYLKNVMRVIEGDAIRLFNGKDGEFTGRIEKAGKKAIALTLENRLRDQPPSPRGLYLFFAPLKKERMSFLIEKAVELGVTAFHPVLTQRTDAQKMNEDRVRAQIIEAAEQCERLDLPVLYAPLPLKRVLGTWKDDRPLFAALERTDAKPLHACAISEKGDCALLIGPAGGFTAEEMAEIEGFSFVRPVSLGPNILRSETAALAGLAILALCGD